MVVLNEENCQYGIKSKQKLEDKKEYICRVHIVPDFMNNYVKPRIEIIEEYDENNFVKTLNKKAAIINDMTFAIESCQSQYNDLMKKTDKKLKENQKTIDLLNSTLVNRNKMIEDSNNKIDSLWKKTKEQEEQIDKLIEFIQELQMKYVFGRPLK